MHKLVGRRVALAGSAALATAALIRSREARAAKALTVVLESEVTILDPQVITATITRIFGLHVFDMLFAMNEKGEIKPQMVESYDGSPDKLTWRFVLRDGLEWHDGQPVTAEDCVASLKPSRVLVQNMRDVGFTVEQQPRDWPTVLARRAKKEGWSMFPVYSNGTDMFSPLTHFYVAATCNDFPGWSCDNRVPELMKAYTRAATVEERRKIAADIQVIAYEMVPP